MNPTEQLAHFDGADTDVPMTGLWYSHNRVRELVDAARQECRDRDATEADVRARLADAEAKLLRLHRVFGNVMRYLPMDIRQTVRPVLDECKP